jgi:hypothetical protein
MVRALDCGSRCWGFESPHSPQQICFVKFAVTQLKSYKLTDIRILLRYFIFSLSLQLSTLLDAPVAQWIRASASGAEGRRFESSQARFFSRKWAVSSAGRAADS